ncbi:UPF0228 family protein [Methanolobus sp. ZRKC2]|uniref:UPF0228 family protein n=1 Tax=Methanolobus sp. ZRKC2 TaxID=3125783 RepID=UPI003246A306
MNKEVVLKTILVASIILLLSSALFFLILELKDPFQSTDPKTEKNSNFSHEWRKSPKTINERKIGGLVIGFQEGTNETEAKLILENYDFVLDYRLDYNIDYIAGKHYIVVNKDERMAIKKNLSNAENWIESGPDIKKENYYIIQIWKPLVDDEDFIRILDEQELELKKYVWCYVFFDDESRYWIDEKTANEMKIDLEKNDEILDVAFADIEG